MSEQLGHIPTPEEPMEEAFMKPFKAGEIEDATINNEPPEDLESPRLEWPAKEQKGSEQLPH